MEQFSSSRRTKFPQTRRSFCETTEACDPAANRQPCSAMKGRIQMRYLLRAALAAAFIAAPFASAYARGALAGMHSGQSLDSSMGSVNAGQTIGGSRLDSTGNTDQDSAGDFRQDFDGIRLPRPDAGTRHRSFRSGSRMDMNSVGQSTANPGNDHIRVR